MLLCCCCRCRCRYDASADLETLHALTLPICDGVTQFYRERFPNTNASTGLTDLFPAQVIESYVITKKSGNR